jgi:hypothetical protein
MCWLETIWMLTVLKCVALQNNHCVTQTDTMYVEVWTFCFVVKIYCKNAVFIFRILQAPISLHICQMRRTKSMQLIKAWAPPPPNTCQSVSSKTSLLTFSLPTLLKWVFLSKAVSPVLVPIPFPALYKDCYAASITTNFSILHNYCMCMIVNAIATNAVGYVRLVCV